MEFERLRLQVRLVRAVWRSERARPEPNVNLQELQKRSLVVLDDVAFHIGNGQDRELAELIASVRAEVQTGGSVAPGDDKERGRES
ncbi:MAG TPA: hypothetical protein VHK28_04270 [Candidatus Limnocylindria bacterium]|nr:hypothetical protein [Candidatus Limnocylindria bacterium]